MYPLSSSSSIHLSSIPSASEALRRGTLQTARIAEINEHLKIRGLPALPIGPLERRFAITQVQDWTETDKTPEGMISEPERLEGSEITAEKAKYCIRKGVTHAFSSDTGFREASPFFYPVHAWSITESRGNEILQHTMSAVAVLGHAKRPYRDEMLKITKAVGNCKDHERGKALAAIITLSDARLFSPERPYRDIHDAVLKELLLLPSQHRAAGIFALIDNLSRIRLLNDDRLRRYDELFQAFHALDDLDKKRSVEHTTLYNTTHSYLLTGFARKINALPPDKRLTRWDRVQMDTRALDDSEKQKELTRAYLAGSAVNLPSPHHTSRLQETLPYLCSPERLNDQKSVVAHFQNNTVTFQRFSAVLAISRTLAPWQRIMFVDKVAMEWLASAPHDEFDRFKDIALDERARAYKKGDKQVADTLKLVTDFVKNGVYEKTQASMDSALDDPDYYVRIRSMLGAEHALVANPGNIEAERFVAGEHAAS